MVYSRRKFTSPGSVRLVCHPVPEKASSLGETASKILSSLPKLDLADRLAQTRLLMRQHGLPALIITDQRKLRYFTGSDLPAALLAIDPIRSLVLLESGRSYHHLLKDRSENTNSDVTSPGDLLIELADFFKGSSVIGIDGSTMKHSFYDALKRSLPTDIELRSADNLIATVCGRKNESEISRIRAAANILARSLDVVGEKLYHLSESELAAEIDNTLDTLRVRDRPAKGRLHKIKTRVAYGVNAADITHDASSVRLKRGELAVVSAGAVVDGYWAIESRTLGTTNDPELSTVLSAVHQLERRVRKLAQSGMGLDEVFSSTISDLRNAGIAKLAPHGPCFSVGTDIGEAFGQFEPEETMPICVQPGLYVIGKGGARIGRTDSITATSDTKPTRIGIKVSHHLTKTPAYYSCPFSVDPERIDSYTEILIGDRPGRWEGGF